MNNSNCNKQQWIVLSENKQLQLLHKRIMTVNQEYLQRERDWLGVKYKLMEMANIFAVQAAGRSIVGDRKKEGLRVAIKLQNSHNDQVNQQFRALFQQQYLDRTLTQLNPNPIESNNTLSKQQQDQTVESSQLLQLASSITNKSNEQIKLEVLKQKHHNQLLEKEIQLLEKEYDCVDKYIQTKFNQTNDSRVEKMTDIDQNEIQLQKIKKSQQQQQQQFHSNITTHPIDINTSSISLIHTTQQQQQQQQPPSNDEQYLQSQISCVNKLIINKLSLIEQLLESNNLVKSKVAELKAKQSYLEKRKIILQGKHNQLERKRVQLMQQYKKQESGLNLNKEDNNIDKNNNNKPSSTTTINQTLINSTNQINQLITEQLAHQLNEQKLKLINEVNKNSIK